MKIPEKWEKRITVFLMVVTIFFLGATMETMRTKRFIENTVSQNTSMVVFLAAQEKVLRITANICEVGNDSEECANMMYAEATLIRHFMLTGFSLDSLPQLIEEYDEEPIERSVVRKLVTSSS